MVGTIHDVLGQRGGNIVVESATDGNGLQGDFVVDCKSLCGYSAVDVGRRGRGVDAVIEVPKVDCGPSAAREGNLTSPINSNVEVAVRGGDLRRKRAFCVDEDDGVVNVHSFRAIAQAELCHTQRIHAQGLTLATLPGRVSRECGHQCVLALRLRSSYQT